MATAAMSPAKLKKVLAALDGNWQAEMEGYHTYQALADRDPEPVRAQVLRHLAAAEPTDVLALWSRLLWRAAAPCVAIMLVMGAWTVYSRHVTSPSQTLAVDLERTVWGPLTSLNDSL